MKLLFLVLLLIGFQVETSTAQASRDFLIASQLIRVQDYERAKKILEELISVDPSNQAYLQQLVNCQINLKEYENAIELLTNPRSKAKGILVLENELANVNHLAGNTDKAFSIWSNLLAQNTKNLMAYQTIAQTMMERREFSKAAEVYKKGRAAFRNSFLFLNELATAYLQSNNYEAAASELITLLETNPGRLDLVQRQFSKFGDEFLLDEAILSLESANLDKPQKDETITQAKRELLLWLYLERNVEKRAISWAKNLERRAPTDYFVYNVAQNLIRKESYELADYALDFYLEKDQRQMKPLAYEAKATLYVKWAKKLKEQGLSVLGKADSLNRAAADFYRKVVFDHDDFEPKDQVLISLIELYLNELGSASQARDLYKVLTEKYASTLDDDQKDFLEGRFTLIEGDFRNARVAFTKANKRASNSDMLEKSRYFLALTDFYAGDFEFSKIQLKSVERQPSSFYANDALKLRNWIRKGIQKDSVLPELRTFSKAMFAYSRTEYDACFTILSSNFDNLNALQEDALLVMTEIKRKSNLEEAYQVLSAFSSINNYEQLLFEKVTLGYFLLSKKSSSISQSQLEVDLKSFLKSYPAGFFADKVRTMLQVVMDTTI